MDDESLSCFLCEESESCLDDDDYEEALSIDNSNSFRADSFTEEDEAEYVNTLFDRETSSGWFTGDVRHHHDGDRRSSSDWIKRDRAEAFSWILRTRALLGFQFQTAYLSMAYFDQFLSRRSPVSDGNWAIRLLTVACLSIAAKMEEIHVPVLSDFNTRDHSFRSQVVQGMELLVLKTLEWRMESITPFLFLHYFISKLTDHRPDAEILPKSIQLILGMARDINVLDHRPSTIAAAAVLAASCDVLAKDTMGRKWNSDSCCARLDADDVFNCYGLMRGLDMDKFLNAGPTTPPDPTTSPVASSGSSLSRSSSAISIGNTKRKRLEFDDENDRSREPPDDRSH